MTLASITRGKVEKPPRVLMFGPEGCGKTTWASNAPNPIFLCSEDGTSQLDVARFPELQSWEDALDAVQELTVADHDYKTLVVDTVDWLEPLCWDFICKRDGMKDVESYGFSKGQNVVALAEWRIFVARIEQMCRAKNMGVIFLAHSSVKTFKNVEADDFDRYEMAMNLKAAGLLKQWSDAVLFARYETFTSKDEKTKRIRGVSTGARVMHTQRTAAYDAKNRYYLPETMPLDYEAFAAGIAAHQVSAAQLVRRIEALLPSAAEETQAKVRAAMQRVGEDTRQLTRIAEKLSAEVNINQQQEQGNGQ
jgi:hypothetical protein